MATGAKGQAGVEKQIDSLGVRCISPARADPQTIATFKGLKIFFPLLRPVFILKQLPAQFLIKLGLQLRL